MPRKPELSAGLMGPRGPNADFTYLTLPFYLIFSWISLFWVFLFVLNSILFLCLFIYFIYLFIYFLFSIFPFPYFLEGGTRCGLRKTKQASSFKNSYNSDIAILCISNNSDWTCPYSEKGLYDSSSNKISSLFCDPTSSSDDAISLSA